jgi:hypothetical protein
MDSKDLENRFTYHAPKEGQPVIFLEIRGKAWNLARVVDAAMPDCREKSLAITKLEEAVMWANAGVARQP